MTSHRITDLAAGVEGTDAVNVSQLNARTKYFRANSTLADASATGTDSVAVGPQAVSSATNAVAVGNGAQAGQAGAVALGAGSTTAAAVGTASGTIAGTTYNYAGATPASTVSVGAAGAERTVTNVAAGRVSATSTDAVNGSQLNATNTELTNLDGRVDNIGKTVADNFGGGSTYDPTTGTVSAPTYNVGGNTYNNVGDALTNVDGRVTTNTTNITNLTNQITNGTIGLVQQDPTSREITVGKDTDGTVINVAGTAGDRKITGVADGAVTTTSTEAINGSQLQAVSQSVADNLGGGSVVNPDGTVSVPTYNIGGNTYNNVGDALTNVDGRVTNVEGAITNISNGGGIKYFHASSTKDDSRALGTDSVAVGPLAVAAGESGTAVGHGSSAAGGFSTALGVNAQANGGNSIALGQATVGAERAIGIGANGDQPLVDAASREAVAIGDHAQVNQSIEAVVLGAGARATNAPESVALGNDAAVSVQDAVAIGNSSVASHKGAVALGAGAETSEGVTTASGVIAGTTYTYAGVAESTVSIGKAGRERSITNVAAGRVNATSTDAVNGSQLHATNTELTNLDGRVDNLGETVADNLGGGSTYDPTTGTVSAPTYNVGGNTYNNVGDALTNVDGRVTTNTTNITNLTNQITNGTIGLVQQDPISREITVGKGTDGDVVNVAGTAGDRRVTGVADGRADNDAINVRQLNAGVASANRYTDERVGQLTGELRRDTYAAVASALAVKQAPWVAGKTTYYAGVGGYKSQAALGVSLRRTADSGRWSLEGGFSADRNGGGAYVGVSGVLGD